MTYESGETTIFAYDASNRLVAEYSTVVEPPATAKTSYLTNDHLGSPRITTDQFGQAASRRDFHPFGEEIFRAGYGSDSVRQKFTGYERDGETALDFAQARMYNYRHGRFTAVDPLMASASPDNPQSWNRYSYTFNNPLNFVDPTGEMTDYVDDRTGKITHIDDEKDQVIATTTTVINRMQELANQGDRSAYNTTLGALESNDVTNLHMTRHEFMSRASTTYAESSFPWSSGDELANEMNAIAWVNTRNGEAYGARSPDAQRYNNTAFGNQDDKMKLANLAIVNQLRGGPDPSNGAGFWDGMEQAQFPDSNKSRSVKVTTSDGRHQSWELHKNTIGWSISDEHYAKWKKNIGGSFRAPQVSKTAAGKIGYHSTAVWGRTIFWRK